MYKAVLGLWFGERYDDDDDDDINNNNNNEGSIRHDARPC